MQIADGRRGGHSPRILQSVGPDAERHDPTRFSRARQIPYNTTTLGRQGRALYSAHNFLDDLDGCPLILYYDAASAISHDPGLLRIHQQPTALCVQLLLIPYLNGSSGL